MNQIDWISGYIRRLQRLTLQNVADKCGFFAQFAGWRVIAPSNPFDYAGFFNTAYRSLNPVLVIGHYKLYPLSGKACMARQGTKLTIVTWS